MYIKIEKVINEGGNTVERQLRFITSNFFDAKGIYKKNEENKDPLAEDILSIDGIDIVDIEDNTITITKSEDFEWSMIKPQVLGIIMDNISSIVSIAAKADPTKYDYNEDFTPSTELEVGIQKVLNERIVPSVQADGGDLDFLGIKDGVVMVRLKGACVGCASSNITLKNGIERILQHFFKEEVKEVVNLE